MEKILKREIELLKSENEVLTRQVDNLAEKIVEIDNLPCYLACPIGNPLDCDCECFDPEVWKEWAKKDE
nr:MAG TPA: Transcriptional regulator, MerR-family, MerR family, Transcription activator.01A [Caudoviricetes sp.]